MARQRRSTPTSGVFEHVKGRGGRTGNGRVDALAKRGAQGIRCQQGRRGPNSGVRGSRPGNRAF
eukprot:7095949-Lingulodinium_polyedra.AAC.1